MNNTLHTKNINTRVTKIRPLLPPHCLLEELPLGKKHENDIHEYREKIADIIHNRDKKFLIVLGPCSIHDVKAAIEYAKFLKKIKNRYSDQLFIVIRIYFEKPRTTIGWKGLIFDPDLNNECNINKGLKIARKLLSDISSLELPIACEFLDTITPQYIADFVSLGFCGARSSENQTHRQLFSALSMPISFKNGTNGDIKIAIDAIITAKEKHTFLGINEQGMAGIVETSGNSDSTLCLRGGNNGPNYSHDHIINTTKMLETAKINNNIIIDCSHGNSNKSSDIQEKVIYEIAEQIKNHKYKNVVGVMIESNIVSGRQDLSNNGSNLIYGKSITDECINLEQTEKCLDALYEAIKIRNS